MKKIGTLICVILSFCNFSKGQELDEAIVRVYPNPFRDQISMHLTLGYGDTLEFNLFSIQGKAITRLSQRIVHESKDLVIHLDSLPLGIYVTRFSINKESISGTILKDQPSEEVSLEFNIEVRSFAKEPLKAYPNPSHGNFSIDDPLLLSGSFTLEIFDHLGKRVHFEKRNTPLAGRQVMTFATEHLASGVYLLRLISGDVVKKGKITIQH